MLYKTNACLYMLVFIDKHNLKEFITTRPGLEQIINKVLQCEEKALISKRKACEV